MSLWSGFVIWAALTASASDACGLEMRHLYEKQGKVRVNPHQVLELARFIESRKSELPDDKEDSSLSGFSELEIANFNFLLVAICHQTTPKGLPMLEGEVSGQHRRGWDYLSARLEEQVRADRSLIDPKRWSQMTGDEVRELWRDSKMGELLTDPEGRAALIRDLGQKLLRSQRPQGAIDLFRDSRAQIYGSPNSLLSLLSEFEAFNDPVMKKSVFFLALMKNYGLWAYRDEENLGPPIDYHEARGHLRLGTVEIIDPALRRKILEGLEVTNEEDIQIRAAIFDAIMGVSVLSGLNNPSLLHYMFWNVFRNVCTRDNPQCAELSPNNALPERYIPLTINQSGQKDKKACPFGDFCPNWGIINPIQEHQIPNNNLY